jgi:uncharacterized protein
MSQDRYALITGGSSGIGACFARALAARKHNLILVARSREKLQALADELKAAHAIRALALDYDLSVAGAAHSLASQVKGEGLDVDLLINNAGFGARGEFWTLPLDRLSQMLSLNVQALVELTHLMLPAMITQKRGGVINVSSTAGFQPLAYTATYAATKAFVTSFSMALAEEVRPYGVKVVTLCPGATRTNFFVAGNYQRHGLPGGMQAPEAVVKAALKALDRKGGLVVPRLINKLSVVSQRLVSRRRVAKIAADIFRP